MKRCPTLREKRVECTEAKFFDTKVDGGVRTGISPGLMSVREFAPSDELPTGKDGAMFRTQFAQSMNFKISKS